jgi:hypothetical protein
VLREEGAGLDSGEAGGRRLRAHPDEAITNLNVLFMKAASESLLAGFTHAVIEYSLLITK